MVYSLVYSPFSPQPLATPWSARCRNRALRTVLRYQGRRGSAV